MGSTESTAAERVERAQERSAEASRTVLVAPGSMECRGRNPTLDRLPVQLDVAIPLRDFRVRDLLAMEPGRVVETEWVNGDDLPLFAGQVQLAWSEFEVVDARLAVRVTRLA